MSRAPSDTEDTQTIAAEDSPAADGAYDPDAPASDGEEARAEGPDMTEPASVEELIQNGEVHPVVVAALAAAEAKAKEAEDRMLRAVAESQNERRRLAKDQADRIRYANESLLGELLPVLDNLELCLAHAGDADAKNLRTGVEMTVAQFKQAVQNVGAEPIPTEVGGDFDPKLHEAIMQDDAADLPARTISQVMQSGFTYRERVIRPSKVAVSTGKGQKH